MYIPYKQLTVPNNNILFLFYFIIFIIFIFLFFNSLSAFKMALASKLFLQY